MCVKWELVWVGLPCFVQCFGFCSSSNELWKPWLQLECLIATEKREGALVNREKARGEHVLLSKGQDCPDHRWGSFVKMKSNWMNHLVRRIVFYIHFRLLQKCNIFPLKVCSVVTDSCAKCFVYFLMKSYWLSDHHTCTHSQLSRNN